MSVNMLYPRAADVKVMMTEITGAMANIQPPNPACFNVAAPKGDACKEHHRLLSAMYTECGKISSQAGQVVCFCKWGMGDEILDAVEPCVKDVCTNENDLKNALSFAQETNKVWTDICSKHLPEAYKDDPSLQGQIDAGDDSEDDEPTPSGAVNSTTTAAGPGETSAPPDSAAGSITVRLRDVALVGMLAASIFGFGAM